MRKFFSFFAALLFAGSMMAAEPYTLKFNYFDNAGSDKGQAETKLSGLFDAASLDYVDTTAATTLENVYLGRKYKDAASGDSIFSNIKFGTSSKAGTLKFALKNMNVDSVVFRAAMYGKSEGTDGFTVNGTAFTLSAGNKVFENVTYVPAGKITALEIVQAKASSGRFYLTSITVYPGEGAPVGAPKYYVAGSMNEWKANANYKLAANPAVDGEFMGEFTFKANDEFKVIMDNGSAEYTWYPAGTDNNWKITEDGDYKVYFRPAGNTAWANGYFDVMMKEPALPISCADVYKLAKNDVVENLNEVVVTYVNGKNVWVKDETASMLLYLSANATWAAGDKLAGVAGTVDIYNGVTEIKPTADQVAAVTATPGEAPAAEEKDSVVAADVNKYIVMNGIEFEKDTAFVEGKQANITMNGVAVRNQFKNGYEFKAGKKYNVYGVVTIFSNNPQVYFITAEEEVPVVHTYTVAGAPSTVFGDNWNPALEANDMQQLIGGDGYIWSKDTAEVSVGTLVFKVVEDHSWNNKAYPAENYILELEPAYYNIVITFNPTAQPDSMVKAIATKVGELPVVGVETVYNWAKDAADQVGTTIFGGNSNITTGTVKIHENADDVNGIKFGSSYVYADGKYIAIKPAEGGFKAGDEISLSVVFNNSDVTKYCMADVYAADQTTRLFRSDSASTLNGRNAGDPIVQTYTLEADQDSLFLGRYGNTGMFITLLKVTRALVPPTPENTYTIAGSPATLFGTAWDPANEANDMKPITGSKYLYAWEKDSVALTAGDIEFKVCENHAWTKAWPAQNYKLNIAEAGLYKVSIFFNPEFGDSAVYAMAEKKGEAKVLPNIILHGNFTGTWADTEAFTPASDSLTASLTLALTAGTFEFGFKFDGAWKANGANLTREANTANLSTGEGNMHITADVPGNYIFTYTYETEGLVVTYPEPIIVPDTIDVTMSSLTAPGSLIWDDEVATEGWWQIMGGNDTCQFSLSNGNQITTAAGTYTVADLDANYSYIAIVKANDTIEVAFVDGSITVAVDEAGVVTIVGALLGNDGNVYNFNLTYVDPKAETTVNVNIAEGKMYDLYADDGLYGVYGTDTTANVFVQLAIWAEDGFQGNFTEKDLDFKYVGSGIVEGLTAPNIYTAAITVTPGNGGDYNITADILCYNNKLYKVTMYIPGAQGIEGVEAAVKATKSLQNGILVIEKNGVKYNVTGLQIR